VPDGLVAGNSVLYKHKHLYLAILWQNCLKATKNSYEFDILMSYKPIIEKHFHKYT
jgi:hypothetical protein